MIKITSFAALLLTAAACNNTQSSGDEATDTATLPTDTIEVPKDTAASTDTDTVDYGKRDQETMRGILDGI